MPTHTAAKRRQASVIGSELKRSPPKILAKRKRGGAERQRRAILLSKLRNAR